MPTPIYTPEKIRCAFQLNWSYTLFWRDVHPGDAWLQQLKDLGEQAGIRVLSHRFASTTCSQFLLSTLPSVKPSDITKRMKGWLQMLVRHERPRAFQRNYDLHSVGSTQRQKVEHYVAGQLEHHATDGSRIDSAMIDLQWNNPEVDLGRFRLTNHARYRCNLHAVMRFVDWARIEDDAAGRVRSTIRKTAERHQHLLSRIGLLDDHVHIVLGSGLQQSPLEVVLPYMNNIAWQFGMEPVLWPSCFFGTIGEYDLGAIPRPME